MGPRSPRSTTPRRSTDRVLRSRAARGVGLGGASALLTALLTACGGDEPARGVRASFSTAAAAADPIAFGEVPDFALVAQTGERVTRASLLGRPWVAAAVFSTCTGPCPRIAGEMAELQGALADTDALLISVTVDPERDSPEVLARWAERLGADPERWLFLSGPEDEVYTLVRDGFKLGVEREDELAPIGRQVTHGTKLLAVDRRGRIRGWYDSQGGQGLAALRERMRHLAEER